MADYLTARAALASQLGTVTITSPVASILNVYETPPDSGAVMEYPAVVIVGYAITNYVRSSGLRERTYNVGLRLVCRPIAGATMRAQLDALKEAISVSFDQALTLGLGGGYLVMEGPHWVQQEPIADGGAVWDEGAIVLILNDAVAFSG